MNHTISPWVGVLFAILLLLMGASFGSDSASRRRPIVLSGILARCPAPTRECPMRLHYINLTEGNL